MPRILVSSVYEFLQTAQEYMVHQLFENHIVEQSVKLVVDVFTVCILVATIMLQVVSMVIAANNLVSSFYGLLCQQISSALSTLLFIIPIERERKAIVLSGKKEKGTAY
jgi:hypothetical protein